MHCRRVPWVNHHAMRPTPPTTRDSRKQQQHWQQAAAAAALAALAAASSEGSASGAQRCCKQRGLQGRRGALRARRLGTRPRVQVERKQRKRQQQHMTGLQQRRDKNIKRSCCRPIAVDVFVFVVFFVAFTLPLLLLLFIVFTFSQATPTSASAPAPDDVDVVVVCVSRCHGAMTTSFWGVYESECASVCAPLRLCVCATYTCAICCCCCLLQKQQHGQSSMHLYAQPVYGFL